MDEIIGNERVVALVRAARASGSMHHAYLFTGPSGSGKATLARVFARALNCTNPAGVCGIDRGDVPACRSCRLIERGVHPDVRTIELAADTTKISYKEIEQLQAEVVLRPLEAVHKCYLILGAERLSTVAANQLLKTLEEPPSGVVLVLTTPAAEALLPTIVSRCQEVRLSLVSTATLEAYLQRRVGLDEGRASCVARLAQGRIGRAMQLASDDEAMRRKDEAIGQLARALSGGRLDRLQIARALADQWSGHAPQVRETLQVWAEWIRDAIRVHLGLVSRVVHAEYSHELRESARTFSRQQMQTALGVLQHTAEQLEWNANPRLALDVALLSLPRPARAG